MKTKKLALAILLSVVMVVSAVLIVACGEKEVKIDLLGAKDWEGFNDEVAYTIKDNSDGSLQVDYEKNDTWQLFTRTMVESVEDLAKVKKLVAKVKMTSDQTTPELMFKFEGSDDPATAEVTIQVGSEYKIYEWTLGQYTTSKAYDLTKASALRIFADPGDATAKGSITFAELYLSSKEVNEENAVELPAPPEPPKPEVHEWNEITADKAALSVWEDGGSGVYKLTKDGTTLKVAVDKDAVEGDDAWAAMVAYIHGDALKTMKSFKIVIKGTAGTSALVKPFDACETRVNFNGMQQEVIINVAAHAADAARDFSKKDFPTGDNKLAILALPNSNEGKTDIEIISAEFSTAEAPEPEAVSYPGDLLSGFNTGWKDGGDGHWTVGDTEGVPTLTYNAGNSWSSVTTTALIEGAPLNYILWEVKGTKDTVGILSVEFSDGVKAEAHFEGNGAAGDHGKFTGEWQTVAVPLDKARSGDVTVRIFAGFNDGDPAGEIQVRRAQFMYVAAVADTTKDFNANGLWLNAVKDSERNTIKYENGKTTITYNTASWDSVLAWIDLGEGGYDHITITIKGLKDHTAIIKVGTTEKKFEGNPGDEGRFTGDEQTITIDVSGLTGIVEFRMFFDFNSLEGESGSVEITQALFSKAA